MKGKTSKVDVTWLVDGPLIGGEMMNDSSQPSSEARRGLGRRTALVNMQEGHTTYDASTCSYNTWEVIAQISTSSPPCPG